MAIFNLVRQTAQPADAELDGKKLSFRIFTLRDWGLLSKESELVNPMMGDLIGFALGPVGVPLVLKIALLGNEPLPDLAGLKADRILADLVSTVLDIKGGPVPPLTVSAGV